MHMRLADAENLADAQRSRTLESFRGNAVHGVAGIGNPQRFFDQLRDRGIQVTAHPFPDHHPFTPEDLMIPGADPILMTEKDAVKCRRFATPRCWMVPARVRTRAGLAAPAGRAGGQAEGRIQALSTDFHVIIPARYGAQRLPGKPLRDLGGRPLIQHVYERSRRSRAATVTVATDDQRVVDAVVGFGGDVCMTATEHPSGTDRIAEACHRLKLADDAIVVNVQGDEPQMPGALIDQVADALASNPPAAIATACEPIEGREELDDPSVRQGGA